MAKAAAELVEAVEAVQAPPLFYSLQNFLSLWTKETF
jgi:hypothetical protein